MELIIVENFPNMAKGTSIKVQEAPSTLLKISKNRSTPCHLIVKLTSISDKDKILKEAWEKKSVTYNGKNIDWQQTYPQKPGRPERTGLIYSEH